MIQNFYSLNTLLKHLNSVHSKSSIAGVFLLILLLFSVSCSNNKDGKIESSVATFNECIFPRGAVIYKNYLIIVGENTSHEDSPELLDSELNNSDIRKIFVFNLLTDKRDDAFRKKIQLDGLVRFFVRNDTLFAEINSIKYNETHWKKWKDDAWIDSEPFPASKRFNTSCLRKACYPIFDDSEYIIYGYSQGEFGNAVLFLNKKNGVIRGYPMKSGRKVIKDTSGYVILGVCYHMGDFYEVVKIAHPEMLPIVPDSLIHYNCSGIREHELYSLDNYLEDQIIRSFPEKICKKINIAKSNIYINRNDSIEFNDSAFSTYRSLYDEYDNYSYDLLIQNVYDVTCNSIFKVRGKLYCILKKYVFSTDSTCFFLTELNNKSTEKVLDNSMFVLESPVKWSYSISTNNSEILVFEYSDWESPCHKFTCLIINDQFIKTYHFVPKQN